MHFSENWLIPYTLCWVFFRWMSGIHFLCQHATITFKSPFHRKWSLSLPKSVYSSRESHKSHIRSGFFFCTCLAAAAHPMAVRWPSEMECRVWAAVAVAHSSLDQTFSVSPSGCRLREERPDWGGGAKPSLFTPDSARSPGIPARVEGKLTFDRFGR